VFPKQKSHRAGSCTLWAIFIIAANFVSVFRKNPNKIQGLKLSLVQKYNEHLIEPWQRLSLILTFNCTKFLNFDNRKPNMTFWGTCIVIYSYNRSQQDALFLNFIFIYNSTCFGQTYCPSPEVLILYSQQQVFVILYILTASRQSIDLAWKIPIAAYTVLRLLMMDSRSVRHMQSTLSK